MLFRSGAVISRLARDPRVRPLAIEHGGVVAAATAGMAAARGRYIARLDADDICYPERLAAQCDLLDARPEIGLVGCGIEYGGDRGSQAGYAAYVDWTNNQVTPEEIELARFVELPVPNPSIMFRHELLARHGGYRQGDFPEDYELLLRWLQAGVRMTKVPRTLLRWNDPPQRLSRTDARYSYDAFFRVKAAYLAPWLAAHNPFHPRVCIWGAGRPSRRRAELLCDHGIEIASYIDVDPKKTGSPVHGRPRYHHTAMPGPDEVFVVSYVAKRGARAEIEQMLRGRGFVAGRNFIHAA